jgi:hypothetical protein
MAINQAVIQKISAVSSLLSNIRGLYGEAKSFQTKVSLYQAGTDTAFNAAANAVIPVVDRARLATLATALGPIIAELEANYADFINPSAN